MSMQRLSLWRRTTLLLLAGSVLTSCAIDRLIQVAAGERRGDTRIIDGDLQVAPGGQVASVRMIDGNVVLERDSIVVGKAHITDGELTMQPGADIRGRLTAHHAALQLDGARIGGDVELFCTHGRVDATRIAGILYVKRKALWHVRCERPGRLVIGALSDIDALVIESTDVEVQVHPDARIGKIEGPVVEAR